MKEESVSMGKEIQGLEQEGESEAAIKAQLQVIKKSTDIMQMLLAQTCSEYNRSASKSQLSKSTSARLPRSRRGSLWGAGGVRPTKLVF